MKITRTKFSIGTASKEYYMDRPYDEQKDNQTNCDEALSFFMACMKDGEAVAVLHQTTKGITPVLLNLKNVISININNVAVYQTKPDDDTKE
jgi:hypothetical protein